MNTDEGPSAWRSFAHGLALAAAVPYVSLLMFLAMELSQAQGEEHAWLAFVTTILAFVGYPVALACCFLVFGSALWANRRLGWDTPGPYMAWGLAGGLALFLLLWIGGPRSAVDAGHVRGIVAAALIGCVSGAAFWLGAVRTRKPRGGPA